MRRCRWHDGDVPDGQAREVYTTTAISGPERPVYACEPCIRTHGLLPASQPVLIGRRDAAPIAPGGAA